MPSSPALPLPRCHTIAWVIFACLLIVETACGSPVYPDAIVRQRGELFEKAKEGSIEAAAHLIDMAWTQDLRNLDLKSKPIHAWKLSDESARGMTGKQLYGYILLAQATDKKKEPGKSQAREAEQLIRSSALKNGMLLYSYLLHLPFGATPEARREAQQLALLALTLLREPPKDSEAFVKAVYWRQAFIHAMEALLPTDEETLLRGAIEDAGRSAQAFGEAGVPFLQAQVLSNQADMLLSKSPQRDLKRAVRIYEQAASLAEKAEFPGLQGTILHQMGRKLSFDADSEDSYKAAADACRRAAAAFAEAKMLVPQAHALESQALNLDGPGNRQPNYVPSKQAAELIEQAIALAEQAGDKDLAKQLRQLLRPKNR